MTTVSGKCWIYKRAAYYEDGRLIRIIDYSNGTDSFDCNMIISDSNGLFYKWHLPNQELFIPLNISRKNTESIIKQGRYTFDKGEIRWEYIYGKYRSYSEYNWDVFLMYLPFVLIVFILCLVIIQKQ